MAIIDDFFGSLTGETAKKEEEIRNEIVAGYEKIGIPSVEAQRLALEEMQYMGDYDADQQGASEFGNIQEDAGLRQSQIDALGKMQEVTEGGGMTDMDRARLNQIQGQIGQQSRGAREAILQNAYARGVGGSGLELAAQLQNQQGAASRASDMGFNTAAEAQQRALQAMQMQAGMGGQLRGQDWQQNAQGAQAQDAINRFNTANRMQAGMAGWGAQQDIANQNVNTRNRQQQYNKELQQREFQNRMAKQSGISGARRDTANMYGGRDARGNQLIGTAIETTGKALAGGA